MVFILISRLRRAQLITLMRDLGVNGNYDTNAFTYCNANGDAQTHAYATDT